MLFHEIYGSYFRVVAAVLAEANAGRLTERRLAGLVRELAFAESALAIPAALKSGAWPLLRPDGTTPLRHPPTQPLTTLQKRWLKTLLQDPRIALFAPGQGGAAGEAAREPAAPGCPGACPGTAGASAEDCAPGPLAALAAGLEGVEPLCPPGTVIWFDRYADGDDYADPGYVARFGRILDALRQRRPVRLQFVSRTGRRCTAVCLPQRLEYSAKDDKFRLLALGRRGRYTVNLARVYGCSLPGPERFEPCARPAPPKRELTLRLLDTRNALERVLLHFSDLEKETVRIGPQRYRLTLRYDEGDETELLIRVLSFGPVVRVESPPAFAALVAGRIERQCALLEQEYGTEQEETGCEEPTGR